jgi:hypothetical protein
MSELESSVQRASEHGLSRPEVSAGDAYLALLLRVIDELSRNGGSDAPPSISVSVVVGGQLWAGQLVSNEYWQISVARAVRSSSNTPELGEALAEVFDRIGEMAEPLRENPAFFVHLIDAHPVDIAGPSIVGGYPMRFRLADVQAWTIGRPGVRR